MTKVKGWKILLGILAFFSIINIIAPFVNQIEKTQGTLTALIILVIIIYLLFKDYNIEKPK